MKKYFLLTTVIVILSIIITFIIGSKQNKEYKEDFISYKKAIKEALEGKNIDYALEKIDYMSSKNENNYIFNIDRANMYNLKKDYDKAKEELKKAIDKNSKLENNPEFLIFYAQILLNNKNYKECRLVIEKIKKDKVSDKLTKKVEDILKKID